MAYAQVVKFGMSDKLGPLSYQTPEPGEIPEQLARIMALEGSGWKQRSGTALSADYRMRCFITQLANAFVHEDGLVFAFLKFCGHDVACRFILRQQSGWFEIKIGFDEEFSHFVPGILLTHETLREACRTGMTKVDFLGVYERWQDNWPHEVTEDYRFATYPFRPSGALALLDDSRQAILSLLRKS